MTDTPTQRVEQDGSQNNSEIQHDWHVIDSLNGIECKRHGLDTYELRTKDGYHITINQIGFDAFRTSQSKFIEWMTSVNLRWTKSELEP